MTAGRTTLLRLLDRVSQLDGDVRFGQLVANLASMAAGPWDQTLWDVEDDQLVDALQQLVNDLSERHQSVA